MKKKLAILVDGSYYLYSFYYALPNLINSIGEPTGVIYGVINLLKNMLIRYRPECMIMVFDARGGSFRDKLFKDYKLRRKPMPEDLCVQIPDIHKIVKAMGIPLLIVPGVEADDIIGTLSMFFSEILGHRVYIFSGDKDMMQLITDDVYVVNSRLNVFFTKDEVQKRFGIFPNLIVDYLSLLGDIVDNVPGVPGIGNVSAKILVQQLGSLDAIYSNLDKISSLNGLKRGKSIALNLEKYRFLALLSYQLVSIKKDVLLNETYDDWTISSIDFDTLMFFFQRYEFKSWLRSLISGEWLLR